MRWIIIAGLIFLLFIILVKMPVPVKVKIYLNAIDMKMYYSIKLINFKILVGKMELNSDGFCVQNTHDIFSKIDVKDKKKEGLFIKEVLNLLTISKFETYFLLGSENDASVTSMLSSIIYSVVVAVSEILASRYQCIHIYQNVYPRFGENVFEISLKSSAQISIDKIVTAKMIANKKHKENINGK